MIEMVRKNFLFIVSVCLTLLGAYIFQSPVAGFGLEQASRLGFYSALTAILTTILTAISYAILRTEEVDFFLKDNKKYFDFLDTLLSPVNWGFGSFTLGLLCLISTAFPITSLWLAVLLSITCSVAVTALLAVSKAFSIILSFIRATFNIYKYRVDIRDSLVDMLKKFNEDSEMTENEPNTDTIQ